MAWEWSHAQEAYALAEKNLHKKSIKWLAECYAEWKCRDITRAEEVFTANLEDMLYRQFGSDEARYVGLESLPDVMLTDPLTDGRYEGFIKSAKDRVKHVGKDRLVDQVWLWACEQRTCENGGYNPWMCPHGCHTVEW